MVKDSSGQTVLALPRRVFEAHEVAPKVRIPRDQPLVIGTELVLNFRRDSFWPSDVDTGGDVLRARRSVEVQARLVVRETDDGFVGSHELMLPGKGYAGESRLMASRHDALLCAGGALYDLATQVLKNRSATKLERRTARALQGWVKELDLC